MGSRNRPVGRPRRTPIPAEVLRLENELTPPKQKAIPVLAEKTGFKQSTLRRFRSQCVDKYERILRQAWKVTEFERLVGSFAEKGGVEKVNLWSGPSALLERASEATRLAMPLFGSWVNALGRKEVKSSFEERTRKARILLAFHGVLGNTLRLSERKQWYHTVNPLLQSLMPLQGSIGPESPMMVEVRRHIFVSMNGVGSYLWSQNVTDISSQGRCSLPQDVNPSDIQIWRESLQAELDYYKGLPKNRYADSISNDLGIWNRIGHLEKRCGHWQQYREARKKSANLANELQAEPLWGVKEFPRGTLSDKAEYSLRRREFRDALKFAKKASEAALKLVEGDNTHHLFVANEVQRLLCAWYSCNCPDPRSAAFRSAHNSDDVRELVKRCPIAVAEYIDFELAVSLLFPDLAKSWPSLKGTPPTVEVIFHTEES